MNAHVDQPGPRLSGTSIRKSHEVVFLQALELEPLRLVSDTFVLDGSLVTIRQPANHERNP